MHLADLHAPRGPHVPGAGEVEAWVGALAAPDLDDVERVDRIRVLEELKDRIAAAQAQLSSDLDASQCVGHATLRVPASERGRGVASLVAAARRESPARGAQHLGLATVLVDEMPFTLVAMQQGRCSEWRATILARETACLSREDRAAVDQVLMSDPARVDGWGDRRLGAEARRLAYELDPQAVVDRTRRAESQQRVTIRPAPDTMAQVTALLPAAQGIAVWATLSRVADTLIGEGDSRTRGQIMADTLVERVTGQSTADGVPITVDLTVSDQTLLAGAHEPAWLADYGPVPAGVARHLVASAVDQALASLRRLYVTPTTGQLVTMESRATTFPHGLRAFIDLRDQVCRTPWCDAPVRHHDHVRALLEGGGTTAVNGQGLCEQCNYAKQAPGWSATPANGPPHTTTTILPTGHHLTSRPPRLPTPAPSVRRTRAEFVVSQLVLTA